jgi:hypothetical protein
MNTQEQVCQKIRSVFPDVGECGIDMEVSFAEEKNAWAVNLKRNGNELTTYLELDETDSCISREKCVGLAFQISQLKHNVEHLKEH